MRRAWLKLEVMEVVTTGYTSHTVGQKSRHVTHTSLYFVFGIKMNNNLNDETIICGIRSNPANSVTSGRRTEIS